MMCALLLVLLLACGVHVNAQTNCQGALNNNSIFSSPATFVNSVTNGKLYKTGANNEFSILHVYGSAYEMGYAQGELLKDDILDMFAKFNEFVDSQIDPYLKDLPPALRKIVETEGVLAALEFEAIITAPWTPIHFYEETKGLSDALNVSFSQIMRFQLFPELIKADCTIVGAWGAATPDQGLMQLRALDWGSPDNPFRQHPQLTVYHPSEGHEFVTLGWNGFLGAVSGFSGYVGASEKVWIHYNGTDSRAGYPWHFLFRDMLQFDETIEDALHRIETAHRTCSIFLGIGDHASNTARIVEYSLDRTPVFNDTTPFPGYAPSPPTHPLIQNVVYVDKHTQPSSDPCLASLLQKYEGQISAQNLINTVSLFETGDMHVGIYDYKNNYMYVSYSDPSVVYPPPPNVQPTPAYKRQFIQLDINSLFEVAQ